MISEKNDFNYKDFLDKNGNDMNFINGKPYSDEYRELAKKWSMFPVYKDYISVKKMNHSEVIVEKKNKPNGVSSKKNITKKIGSNKMKNEI